MATPPPFPEWTEIRSPRLLLRPFSLEAAADIFTLRSFPEVYKWRFVAFACPCPILPVPFPRPRSGELLMAVPGAIPD